MIYGKKIFMFVFVYMCTATFVLVNENVDWLVVMVLHQDIIGTAQPQHLIFNPDLGLLSV